FSGEVSFLGKTVLFAIASSKVPASRRSLGGDHERPSLLHTQRGPTVLRLSLRIGHLTENPVLRASFISCFRATSETLQQLPLQESMDVHDSFSQLSTAANSFQPKAPSPFRGTIWRTNSPRRRLL